MAYTDTITSGFSPIKSQHISELKTAVDNLRTNTKSKDIPSPSLTYNKVNANNIAQLQDAINALELRFSYNCCQSTQVITDCTNKCQTCQNSCTECTNSSTQLCQNICNQCTDICQSCQNTCICQSDRCQSCQSQCRTVSSGSSHNYWDGQSH